MGPVLGLGQDSGVPVELGEDDEVGAGEGDAGVGGGDGEEGDAALVPELELLAAGAAELGRGAAVDADEVDVFFREGGGDAVHDVGVVGEAQELVVALDEVQHVITEKEKKINKIRIFELYSCMPI